MANTLTIKSLVQNLWGASSTKKAVRHGLEDFVFTGEDLKSAVLTLTGTAAGHTLYITGGVMSSSVGDPLNPITGAALSVTGNIVVGFAVKVTRAVSTVAPTGYVLMENGGMCDWLGDVTFHENSYIHFHDPGSEATANLTGLTFNLNNGTGYRVDVIVYFE